MKGLILERVKDKDPYILKAREHMYIRKFDTFRNGLNREIRKPKGVKFTYNEIVLGYNEIVLGYNEIVLDYNESVGL